MKADPYQLRQFQGVMISLVVDEDPHSVVVLSNRVSYIDARVWAKPEFLEFYQPVRLVSDGLETVLRQFRGYSQSVGMTAEAGVYLPKLTPMTDQEVHLALTQGLETRARIMKDAATMAKADGVDSGKAPRKLGGAAAAAVAKKEARLAAEAKALTANVSTDMTAKEAAGEKDVTLGEATKKSVTGSQASAKVQATTPKTKRVADKILRGKDPAAPAKFDPTKLKNSEGKWKSASAMLKGLLYEGKLKDDDKIFAAVQKEFGLSDDKKGYVQWNRGWFKREGVDLPN